MAEPLTGVRVLDLSVWRPGPYCTQLLGELGAHVLKIEPPNGDPMRAFPELFDSLNARKESRRVDLKTDAGRDEVLDLAAQVDVVVEGFRPGVVARLGVGPEQVRARNPSIVYCSISGFGQTGPLAQAPGHDVTYMAWAGALSPDGAPPVLPRVPVADLAAATAAALHIAAACVHKQVTGEGAYLDIAMADVCAAWTGSADSKLFGETRATREIPGYGTFATADGGWIALGVLDEDPFWAALCRALGFDEHAELGFAARTARVTELQAAVAEVVARRHRDDLVTELLAAGVPVAPVLDRPGMLALEHFRARGVFPGP